jgi:hypothetical protein
VPPVAASRDAIEVITCDCSGKGGQWLWLNRAGQTVVSRDARSNVLRGADGNIALVIGTGLTGGGPLGLVLSMWEQHLCEPPIGYSQGRNAPSLGTLFGGRRLATLSGMQSQCTNIEAAPEFGRLRFARGLDAAVAASLEGRAGGYLYRHGVWDLLSDDRLVAREFPLNRRGSWRLQSIALEIFDTMVPMPMLVALFNYRRPNSAPPPGSDS